MSVSLWSYEPTKCDYDYCIGDCDYCNKGEDIEDNIRIEEHNGYSIQCDSRGCKRPMPCICVNHR